MSPSTATCLRPWAPPPSPHLRPELQPPREADAHRSPSSWWVFPVDSCHPLPLTMSPVRPASAMEASPFPLPVFPSWHLGDRGRGLGQPLPSGASLSGCSIPWKRELLRYSSSARLAALPGDVLLSVSACQRGCHSCNARGTRTSSSSTPMAPNAPPSQAPSTMSHLEPESHSSLLPPRPWT